jgi:hypothetical protein
MTGHDMRRQDKARRIWTIFSSQRGGENIFQIDVFRKLLAVSVTVSFFLQHCFRVLSFRIDLMAN